MPTESELRDVLTSLESGAPTVDDVLDRLATHFDRRITQRANPTRRRSSWPVLVAIVVVVSLIAGLGVWLSHRAEKQRISNNPTVISPQPRPDVRSTVSMRLGPRFAFSFDLALPSGQRVETWAIERTFQWALVGEQAPNTCPSPVPGLAPCPYDGYSVRAIVVVFDKGAFDPSKMKSPQRVDVNGMQGLQADVEPINDVVKWTVAPIVDLKHLPRLSTVAWKYAPGSWAVAAWQNNTDPRSKSSALAVARSVRIGARHPALVPFAVTYLPRAVDRRFLLRDDVNGAGSEEGIVVFANAASTRWAHLDTGPPDIALPIQVWDAAPAFDATPQPGDKSLSVRGRPAMYSPKGSALFVDCGTRCTLVVGYGGLGAHLPPSVGLAELTKVAEGVTVASDLHDRRTWFDAATALPH